MSTYFLCIAIMLFTPNTSIILAKDDVGNDGDLIIHEALSLVLPSTNKDILEESYVIIQAAVEKVFESNYQEAIKVVVAGLKEAPQNFSLQAELASLLGDCAQVTHHSLTDVMTQKSKEIFDKLMHELEGQPKRISYRFLNEYHYRFAQYRQQYELGLQKVADYCNTDEWETRGFSGYYSQGVGAANYARVCLQQGNPSLALDYAQKAIVAWAQYFSYCNDYYNAYVHYALALGILGYKQEMMQALAKSASLIKKDMNYFEFKEVIDFVNDYSDKVKENKHFVVFSL